MSNEDAEVLEVGTRIMYTGLCDEKNISGRIVGRGLHRKYGYLYDLRLDRIVFSLGEFTSSVSCYRQDIIEIS